MMFMGKNRPGSFVAAIGMLAFHAFSNLFGGTVASYFAFFEKGGTSFSGMTIESWAILIISAFILPTVISDALGIAGLLKLKNWGRYAGIVGVLLGTAQFAWQYNGVLYSIGIYALFSVILLYVLLRKDLKMYLKAGQWPVPVAVPGAPPVAPKPVAAAPTTSTSAPIVEAAKAEEKKYDVKFSSDYDYYQGFVRLKTWIVNTGETVITDCRVKILFDENFMRISQIDPPLPLRHDEVTVGTVNPDEKKTVTFFLDPLMCQTINLDGTLSFRDAKGHLGTIQMKPQPIGVTCPIFATPDTINTATALNLAKNVLNHRDSRIYKIPQPITCEKALAVSQGIIQRRNVKHVSDLKIQEKFGVMSIYYGLSKLDNRQYIIRTTVLEETGTLELFVAADDESMLTGELAKLGQDLNEALCAEAKVCEPIRHVNISIKDSVIMRTNFLFGEEMDEIMSNIEIKDSAIVRSQIGGAGK